MSHTKNSNVAEKICLILIFLITSTILYGLLFKVVDPSGSAATLLKDALSFGTSVSTISLAVMLYSDWREKHVIEDADGDLKQIKSLASRMKFLLNQIPVFDSDESKKCRAEFFTIFWELRVLNSNLSEDFAPVKLALDKLISEYHALLVKLEDGFRTNNWGSIKLVRDSEALYDELSKLVDDARRHNLGG